MTNKRTDGRANGPTNAMNRIWRILALKCDFWWQ